MFFFVTTANTLCSYIHPRENYICKIDITKCKGTKKNRMNNVFNVIFLGRSEKTQKHFPMPYR